MSVLLHIPHILIVDQNFGTNRFRPLFSKSYISAPFVRRSAVFVDLISLYGDETSGFVKHRQCDE